MQKFGHNQLQKPKEDKTQHLYAVSSTNLQLLIKSL
jgi:hypothetical protein